MKTFISRRLIELFLLTLSATAFAQADRIVSLAYEGGMITHPGVSAGYFVQLKDLNRWTILGGGKLGFYYHRRYHTALFLLPALQAQHTGAKGFLWGVEISAGPQRTFIPHVYKVKDDGSIVRERSAGLTQWVIAPGFRVGRDLSAKRHVPIQWFINPQLQFRKPGSGRSEKYLLMGIGINYKL